METFVLHNARRSCIYFERNRYLLTFALCSFVSTRYTQLGNVESRLDLFQWSLR